MSRDTDAENNARIFGVLSLFFSLIPIVGLILGIIAIQKGRGGRSSFAVITGWIGILLSLVIAIGIGFWLYNEIQDNRRTAEAAAVYSQCVRAANFLPGAVNSNDPNLQALDQNYRDNYYKPGGGRDIYINECKHPELNK